MTKPDNVAPPLGNDDNVRSHFSDLYDGALDESHSAAMRARLAADDKLAAEYRAFMQTTDALRRHTPASVSPAYVEAVMNAVDSGPTNAHVAPLTRLAPALSHAAAAVIGAAVVLASWWWIDAGEVSATPQVSPGGQLTLQSDVIEAAPPTVDRPLDPRPLDEQRPTRDLAGLHDQVPGEGAAGHAEATTPDTAATEPGDRGHLAAADTVEAPRMAAAGKEDPAQPARQEVASAEPRQVVLTVDASGLAALWERITTETPALLAAARDDWRRDLAVLAAEEARAAEALSVVAAQVDPPHADAAPEPWTANAAPETPAPDVAVLAAHTAVARADAPLRRTGPILTRRHSPGHASLRMTGALEDIVPELVGRLQVAAEDELPPLHAALVSMARELVERHGLTGSFAALPERTPESAPAPSNLFSSWFSRNPPPPPRPLSEQWSLWWSEVQPHVGRLRGTL